MTYIAIYQINCQVCEATPVVGLKSPGGHIVATSLCGSHFFGDRQMSDPDEWNRQAESSE